MNFNESADFLSNSLKTDRISDENLTIIIMIKIVSLQLNSILLNRKLPVANHACFRSKEKDVFPRYTRKTAVNQLASWGRPFKTNSGEIQNPEII